jgi:Tfp pilus assembly PilM family ATPase
MMAGLLGIRPGLGLEVGQNVLRAVGLRTRGGSYRMDGMASLALPDGLLLDSFTDPNIADFPGFVAQLKKLFSALGSRGKTVGVALPDYVSRVSVLDFESLHGNEEETERVIRWRLKKLTPFDVDQAAVRYQHLGKVRKDDKDQHRFLVSIIRSNILAQYEAAFKEAGLRPQCIEISSFAVWNIFHPLVMKEMEGPANFALMNIFGRKMTVIVFNNGLPHFLRLKDLGKLEQTAGEDGPMGVTGVLRELNASLVYYKENYAETQVSKVFVAGDYPGLGGIAGEVRGGGTHAAVLELGKVVQLGAGASRPSDELLAYGAACGAAMER